MESPMDKVRSALHLDKKACPECQVEVAEEQTHCEVCGPALVQQARDKAAERPHPLQRWSAGCSLRHTGTGTRRGGGSGHAHVEHP